MQRHIHHDTGTCIGARGRVGVWHLQSPGRPAHEASMIIPRPAASMLNLKQPRDMLGDDVHDFNRVPHCLCCSRVPVGLISRLDL